MVHSPNNNSGEEAPRRGVFRSLRNIEIEIAALILFLFIILATAQVIARYVLNTPLAWIEEVSVIMLIWMTFIGSAWLVRKDQHIRVETLDEFASPRFRLIAYTVYDIISIVFLILLAVGGYHLIDNMRFDRTPALRIPYSYIVAIVPVMSVLMAFYFCHAIYKRVSAPTTEKHR